MLPAFYSFLKFGGAIMSKRIVTFSIFLSVLTGGHAMAQENIYKLHSLFLYNFTKHIQWNNVDGDFTIGVFGNDIALNVVKENLANKKFGDKNIRVIRVAGLGDVKASQLLYAPKSNKIKIIDLISQSDLSNTLVVTEDDLIKEGADISFFISGTRLNFKISKNQIEANGLKVSSALLSLGENAD